MCGNGAEEALERLIGARQHGPGIGHSKRCWLVAKQVWVEGEFVGAMMVRFLATVWHRRGRCALAKVRITSQDAGEIALGDTGDQRGATHRNGFKKLTEFAHNPVLRDGSFTAGPHMHPRVDVI